MTQTHAKYKAIDIYRVRRSVTESQRAQQVQPFHVILCDYTVNNLYSKLEDQILAWKQSITYFHMLLASQTICNPFNPFYTNDVAVHSFSSFQIFLFLDKPAQLVFIWVSFYSLKNIQACLPQVGMWSSSFCIHTYWHISFLNLVYNKHID